MTKLCAIALLGLGVTEMVQLILRVTAHATPRLALMLNVVAFVWLGILFIEIVRSTQRRR